MNKKDKTDYKLILRNVDTNRQKFNISTSKDQFNNSWCQKFELTG